ncbi:MAG: hypothetical protein ACTSRS_18960 [Candidatus Helarchaeota archaeon]
MCLKCGYYPCPTSQRASILPTQCKDFFEVNYRMTSYLTKVQLVRALEKTRAVIQRRNDRITELYRKIDTLQEEVDTLKRFIKTRRLTRELNKYRALFRELEVSDVRLGQD